MAIYEAEPKVASDLVKKAHAALEKAKTDRTVFMKAEGDLKTSGTSATSATSAGAPAAAATATPPAASTTDKTKVVAWLPVDGQLTLAEDFVATPEKAKAVGEANKDLSKGDQKSAVEKLKVAGVGIGFTMAVVPLEKTTSDVEQAGKLIEQGKFYEANAMLKNAEDGVRFDIVDVTGIPRKAADTSAAATPSAPNTTSGTTAPAKPAQ